MKTSTKFVVIAILAIVLYTISNAVFQFITGVGFSDTITVSWFAFWGGEAGILGWITTAKVRHGYYDKEIKTLKDAIGFRVEEESEEEEE